ncbi:hypothetical protein HYPSUDRAFT_400840 [Hypholoma sublateritium FD-334 SS-4]|uniref:Uncharacterized protein n=1 Tax=Hypholoma sublateritium (strain FD-334 SS-4) TaxID=945553 RepID=A0A0D2P9Y6_HYPSF|nr:hypothetical protein HYPSUDRAFT_400840 [Hypholoma sublateritium FD-334 SS-4]
MPDLNLASTFLTTPVPLQVTLLSHIGYNCTTHTTCRRLRAGHETCVLIYFGSLGICIFSFLWINKSLHGKFSCVYVSRIDLCWIATEHRPLQILGHVSTVVHCFVISTS